MLTSISTISTSKATYHWRLGIGALFVLVSLLLGTNPAFAAATGDDERPQFHGLVEQTPEQGRVGAWQIGGQTVIADEQTEFDEIEGVIAAGVCVKVEFVAQGSNVAREIDSEPMDDCTGAGNDDDDDEGRELYGIVEAMPEGSLVGVWTVNSQQYTVTDQSELKAEYGAFDIGRCVKIHLVAGSADTVREMETERSYKCQNGGDDDDDDTPPEGVIGRGEMYGELISFPEGLVGLWEVGTLTFTTTADTEFKTANGDFAVGTIVKVEFYILQDGTFLAREIKTAVADWNDDDDDDNDDDSGRDEGHAFGVIEQLPADGLIGAWIVSGVQYSVTERTELRSRGGTFAISETVKIEFKTDSSGERIAREIKLKFPQGTPGNDEATLVGFVDSMPASGFTGLWIVNGVEFTATAQSKFKEDDGVFTVGAFVKVEYRTVDGQRIVHEMETKVPPGAGDDNHVGQVEAMDDSLMAAGALVNTTWVIGGRSFVVTPSTRVDGSLTPSDTAWVNSYTATDGTQVATRVEGLLLDNFLYLPVTQR